MKRIVYRWIAYNINNAHPRVVLTRFLAAQNGGWVLSYSNWLNTLLKKCIPAQEWGVLSQVFRSCSTVLYMANTVLAKWKKCASGKGNDANDLTLIYIALGRPQQASLWLKIAAARSFKLYSTMSSHTPEPGWCVVHSTPDIWVKRLQHCNPLSTTLIGLAKYLCQPPLVGNWASGCLGAWVADRRQDIVPSQSIPTGLQARLQGTDL